jgi:hypothetical protein
MVCNSGRLSRGWTLIRETRGTMIAPGSQTPQIVGVSVLLAQFQRY